MIINFVPVAYCESGEEKVGDSCVPCPQGYYKDNNIDLFSECTLCPIVNITSGNGSKSLDECRIGKYLVFILFYKSVTIFTV